MSHAKIIIGQWHGASKEARQTREYFEVNTFLTNVVYIRIELFIT
jgi:hypothetical protein